ncbi:MAG: hypothetical protein WBV39_11175 [Rudaea sp.]
MINRILPAFALAVSCVFVTVSVAAAVKPASVAPAGGCGSQSKLPASRRVFNTAHWTTASEEENFGYDVYRGDSEKGPFVKLTKQPLLGNGTTEQTHSYKFVDDSIDPCKDYWYYVESIATDGTREKFTPVFHAPAKRHPAAHAATPSKTKS